MLTAKDSAEKILFPYLRYPIMSIFVAMHRCANEFLLSRKVSPRRLMFNYLKQDVVPRAVRAAVRMLTST